MDTRRLKQLFFNDKKLKTSLRAIGNLQVLPDELLVNIFNYLGPAEQLAVICMCHYFNDIKSFRHGAAFQETACKTSKMNALPIGINFLRDNSLGTIEMYFKQADQDKLEFVKFFLQSLHAEQRHLLLFKQQTQLQSTLVDGYTGKEWRLTINVNDIAPRISAKNIKELMQLFGCNHLDVKTNLYHDDLIYGTTGPIVRLYVLKTKDEINELKASVVLDDLYLSINFDKAALSSIVNAFLMTLFDTKDCRFFKKRYADNTVVNDNDLIIPLNLVYKNHDNHRKLKQKLVDILPPEHVMRVSEILDEIEKVYSEVMVEKTKSPKAF